MTDLTLDQLIASRCRAAGLDLHGVTSVGPYNMQVDDAHRLPGAEESMVVVLGNTRAMWPFVDRFVLDADGPIDDPVDTYVERALAAATADIEQCIDTRFSHEPPPRRVAIQRLAHIAGLGWLSPSHLCVHPEYGPWIALRAAVVLDIDGPADVQPLQAPCDCSTYCMPKLAEALAPDAPVDQAHVIEHWQQWLALRDACPVGRQHRYTDEQIRYHYIGERPRRWG